MSVKSKKKHQSNLIVIDKITDLIRVPLHQLSTVKLSNFTGKYYSQIFEEALKLEEEMINGTTILRKIQLRTIQKLKIKMKLKIKSQ